jgi:hypothetical protein
LDADEQRTHEARAICHCDPIDLRERRPCALERLLNDGAKVLEMVARSELRNHAAIGGVHGDLTLHDVRQNEAGIVDDRRTRFVTRRLDA